MRKMKKGRENGVLTWWWRRRVTEEQCRGVRREQRKTGMMESERMITMGTWSEDEYGQDRKGSPLDD